MTKIPFRTSLRGENPELRNVLKLDVIYFTQISKFIIFMNILWIPYCGPW